MNNGLPDEWCKFRLIDTASPEKYSFTGGPFGSNLKSEDYTEQGIRIIQLQNIGDGCFLNKNKIYTTIDKADELDIDLSFLGEDISDSESAEDDLN